MRICIPNKYNRYELMQDVKLNKDNIDLWSFKADYASYIRENDKFDEIELILKAGTKIKFQNLIIRMESDILADERYRGLDITIYRDKKLEDKSFDLIKDGKSISTTVSKKFLYDNFELKEIKKQ